MDKKLFIEPEMEIIDLQVANALLAGSTDINDDDNSAPSGDGSNPGDPFA